MGLIYSAFLLVFLGEIACRALFGLEFNPVAAFGHGFLAGLAVLAIDYIIYFFQQIRKM
ncbi:hypothetical protein [Solidesulfovibrio sp.]|uniref:hypothetical protein n=1 Tax=Solidesulfovibrio sp. TaxID=2910990 RepID=UPI00262B63C5|nr:hypothetical protein [Solidesulfovibrio sp.]